MYSPGVVDGGEAGYLGVCRCGCCGCCGCCCRGCCCCAGIIRGGGITVAEAVAGIIVWFVNGVENDVVGCNSVVVVVVCDD